MKKFILSLMTISLLFINCKKDDDNSEQAEAKPVPVTINSSTTSSSVNPLFDVDEIINKLNSNEKTTTNTTVNYEYDDNRLITKKTSTTGNDTFVSTYYYHDKSKGLLDSIVENKNGSFHQITRYTISNDKIQKIEISSPQNILIEKYEFTYNGDVLTQFTTFKSTSLGNFNATTDISYNGGNPTSALTSGTMGLFAFSTTSTLTFDDKYTPFHNVATIENPIAAKHNIITSEATTDLGTSTITSTSTYTYTYNNDNFPISDTYENNNNGTISTGSDEFVYENK